MNILRGPERSVGDIDVDSQSSAGAAHRRIEPTKANARIHTAHGFNDIVKSKTLTAVGEKGALNRSVLLRWMLTDEVIKEI